MARKCGSACAAALAATAALLALTTFILGLCLALRCRRRAPQKPIRKFHRRGALPGAFLSRWGAQCSSGVRFGGRRGDKRL